MKFSSSFLATFFDSLLVRRTLAPVMLAALSSVGLIPTASAQQTATVTTLYSFTGGNDGSQPSSLLIASDGNYYGTATTGGAGGYGTIFKLTPTGVLMTIYTFTGGNDGAYPVPGLVQDPDGSFYGVASFDGVGGHGTVFKVTPTGVFTLLHSLTGGEITGYPSIGLARGIDGNYYGTGDSPYQITPAGVFTQFTSGGFDLDFGLIAGQNGNLYGAGRLASSAIPTVVQVTPAGAVTTVGRYQSPRAYPQPFTHLTQARDGNLYGTIDGSGLDGDGGSVFRMTLDGKYTRLFDFASQEGYALTSNSQLVEAGDGSFYGVTSPGALPEGAAPGDRGVLYQTTPTGAFTTLYTFHGDYTGVNPENPQVSISLTLGPDGNLYGTTQDGGTQNAGTIFKATLHPVFFAGAAALDNGVYFLAFPNGTPFGYYSYLTDPNYLYHFDLGYEYVFNANDGNSGVYLYDFKSGSFFYTSPTFPFPYLYDFSLNSVVYYYPDPSNSGRYNTNGVRYFYVFNTGQIISK